MNSNTHNQPSDNSPLFTPSLNNPTHLVIHRLSTISNPSTEDFERLSQQNAQLFFYLLDQQRVYPRSPS